VLRMYWGARPMSQASAAPAAVRTVHDRIRSPGSSRFSTCAWASPRTVPSATPATASHARAPAVSGMITKTATTAGARKPALSPSVTHRNQRRRNGLGRAGAAGSARVSSMGLTLRAGLSGR
jgi:hypothetical protein